MAEKTSTVWVKTEDKPGTWANLTTPLAEANLNVWGFNGWKQGNEAWFVLWTSDNKKTADLLKKAGWKCELKDAVVCEWPNKTGEMASVAKKAAKEGLNLNWFWAWPGKSQGKAWVCLSATDNEKLWKLLS